MRHMKRYYLVLTIKSLDLPTIINWPVNSIPYSECGENEKASSSCKLNFCNKLQLISPLKPTHNPPANIKVCVVDAMIVLSLIPVANRYTAISVYGMG